MTDTQRRELADLETREHLTPKEFDRYEFLKKAAAGFWKYSSTLLSTSFI